MNKGKIRTLIFMFMASVLSKGLALVRTVVFANYFGTGDSATAFFTASNITVQFLEIFLLSIIGSAFIPTYAKIEEERGQDASITFSNNFMNITIIISVIVSLLGILFAPYIVRIITPGLSSDIYLLTVDLVKIIFPSIIFGAMAYVCVAFLQSNFEFNIPNLISVLFNIVIIVYLLIFGSKYGIYGVAFAMIIGWLCQFLVQIPSVIKHKYRFKFSLKFKDKDVIDAFKMAMPIMLISLINPISNMVNTGIASGIDKGHAIAIIEYSYNLYLAAAAIFAYTIGNLMFPTLSKLSMKKAMDDFRKLVSRLLDFVMFYSIPISTIVIICGKQIIKLLYERGEFTSYSTSMTGNVLGIYCLAIMAFSINEIINKSYYSMSKTKIPFVTGLISFCVNVILSLIITRYIGVFGIALSYVIATFVNSLLLLVLFHRRYKIVDKYLGIQLIKNILSSMVMGISLYYLNSLLVGYSSGILYQILVLVIDVLFGIVIYVIMNLMLRNKLVIDIIKMVINKIKNMFRIIY